MNFKGLIFKGLLLSSIFTVSLNAEALAYIEGPIITNRVEVNNKKDSQNDVDNIPLAKDKLAKLKALEPSLVSTWSDFNASEFGFIAPVKDQGYKHTCWAHSIAGVAEAAILMEGLSPLDQPISVSPDNIAYTTRNRISENDPLGNTVDDLYSSPSWNNGYPISHGIERLSQWNGVLLRNDDNSYGEDGFFTPGYLLEESIKIDNTNINKVKEAIAEYGSLTMYYDFDEYAQGDFFKPVVGSETHAVQIIGWDDNIDPKMFKGDVTTPGGWLCKNSWGDNFSNDGLFYLSYEGDIYDTYALNFREYDPNLLNYYYDGMLLDSQGTLSKAAVIFEAKGEDSFNKEILESINVSIRGENLRVKAEIYLNPDVVAYNRMDPRNNPESGILASKASATFKNGGDRSLKLDRPLELKRGDYYSIVVSVEGDGGIVMANEPLSFNDLSFYKIENSYRPTYLNNYGVARINGISRLIKKDNPKPENDLKYARISLDRGYEEIDKDLPGIIPTITYNDSRLYEGIDYDLGYSKEYFINPELGSDRTIVGRGEIRIVGLDRFKGSAISLSYPIVSANYAPVDGVADIDGWGIVYLEAKKDAKRLKDIELPAGYVWENPDSSFTLDTELPFAIRYDGPDKKMYHNLYRSVKISEYDSNAIGLDSLKVYGLNESYSYTGNEIIPKLELEILGTTARLNRDLRIEYINNINVGRAKIILRGMGKFRGKRELEFNIAKANNSIGDIKLIDNKPAAISKYGEPDYLYFKDNLGKNRISRAQALALNIYYVKGIVSDNINYTKAETALLEVNNTPTIEVLKTEASLKLSYDINTLTPANVDLRFGMALKEIDEDATYGILVLKNPLSSNYTKAEMDSLRASGYAIDIKPVFDNGVYRFAWVITNMEGNYNTVLNAVGYKEKNGSIELFLPTSYSVSTLSKYYIENKLIDNQDIITVLKKLI